jgi:hypothetical protein
MKHQFQADIRFRPEWMPEPTEENPVPTLEQASNGTLKKLVRDNKIYVSLRVGELEGFGE